MLLFGVRCSWPFCFSLNADIKLYSCKSIFIDNFSVKIVYASIIHFSFVSLSPIKRRSAISSRKYLFYVHLLTVLYFFLLQGDTGPRVSPA